MNFLKKIGKSVYSPAFYRELLSQPIKKSFKYFFGLVALLSLISAVVFSIDIIPKAKRFLGDAGANVVAHYPSELEVVIKKGIASTNVSEPYMVEIPEDADRANPDREEKFENLLVIDTTRDFSIDQFEDYKTYAWLTRDALVYNDEGKITIQSLKEIPDVTINQAFVSKWVNKIIPWVNKLTVVLPVLIFVALLFVGIVKLLYFLIAALLVMLVLYFKKVKVSYERAYQICLHAFTLSLIVKCASLLFGLPIFVIPFLPTILLLVVVLINVRKTEVSAVA